MTLKQLQIVKLTASDESIQNLTVVKMANSDFSRGDFGAGLSRLKVDADKIRPLNFDLYFLIINAQSEEFELGYNNYYQMMGKSANPYKEDTQKYDDWTAGWERADADCDDD